MWRATHFVRLRTREAVMSKGVFGKFICPVAISFAL